eukprot:624529_1
MAGQTHRPTEATADPTIQPSGYPTASPTRYPSTLPTKYPTRYPSTYPTADPTLRPSEASSNPSKPLTNPPSNTPTDGLSTPPTNAPTHATLPPSKAPIKAPTVLTDSDAVAIVNVTLIAITDNDNTTQIMKYIEDATMNILTAHYDYTPLDTDVIIINTSVVSHEEDTAEEIQFIYTFLVAITLDTTAEAAIDQTEIEGDLMKGFDESNVNIDINIEVYVMNTSPNTSSKSDDDDTDYLPGIFDYIQMRFAELTSIELIIVICIICGCCCGIGLCIGCICMRCTCKKQPKVDDTETDTAVKIQLIQTGSKLELRDDLPNLPSEVNVRYHDKEGHKLDLHDSDSDSDGMYVPQQRTSGNKRHVN